jgi:hypothetical protein
MDADVEDRTTHGRAIRHVVDVGWQSCGQVGIFHVAMVENGILSRGLINGRHVSPWHWFKIYVVGQIRPHDLQAGEKLWEGPPN